MKNGVCEFTSAAKKIKINVKTEIYPISKVWIER